MFFSPLSIKSKTEAQIRKLTFYLQKIMWVGGELWANGKMTICSFDTPIFNIKSGTMYI